MKRLKRIVAVLLMVSVALNCAGIDKTSRVQAKRRESKQSYIICTKSKKELKQLEKGYDESSQINANEEGNLEENQMIALEMTDQEAEALAENPEVTFIEKDLVVEANSTYPGNKGNSKYHKKKEKKIKKNTAKTEWNARMIRAGKVRDHKGKKDGIKIAVLDSGVDYGNDIDLAGSVTLVPDEEEMNPLFMDGSGHGNSVAGLIAATDNEEGITGINPNAQIYSIRVLDDQNCAPVSRVVEGIYMAIDQNVQIINMSFGVSEYSAALEQAVKDAEAAGILMIAAAGNTGKGGVQYPAAFDEVMAVGSVDQNGDAASDSAEGEEMEIVAPGELVRSTGEFGDERVSSGTSLAAPQVAAAASLILEKDPYATPDFVRRLLDESANGYGESEKYGNGLLDIAYALDRYDYFKQQYDAEGEETAAVLEENDKEVLCFEETGCVEGSWSKDNHYGMPVLSGYNNVKKGARYPDLGQYTEKMTLNPWWHGYWQKKLGDTRQYTVNYVASYVYITRLANAQKYNSGAPAPDGMTATVQSNIVSDVNSINWASGDALGKKNPTAGEKRAFIWGMAMHTLADTFAHSAYRNVNGSYHAITHTGKYPGADDTNTVEKRFEDAKEAVSLAMNVYTASNHPNGTYAQFSPVTKEKKKGNEKMENYKLGNIYRYVEEVSGTSSASSFSKYNHKISGT